MKTAREYRILTAGDHVVSALPGRLGLLAGDEVDAFVFDVAMEDAAHGHLALRTSLTGVVTGGVLQERVLLMGIRVEALVPVPTLTAPPLKTSVLYANRLFLVEDLPFGTYAPSLVTFTAGAVLDLGHTLSVRVRGEEGPSQPYEHPSRPHDAGKVPYNDKAWAAGNPDAPRDRMLVRVGLVGAAELQGITRAIYLGDFGLR